MEQENTVTEKVTNAEKPLSFQELLDSNKDYRREFDTRMTKGIETAIENKMAELEAQRTEAEKLAKMKDDEKHQYELKKAQKEKARKKGKNSTLPRPFNKHRVAFSFCKRTYRLLQKEAANKRHSPPILRFPIITRRRSLPCLKNICFK